MSDQDDETVGDRTLETLDGETVGDRTLETLDGEMFNPNGFVKWVREYKHNRFGIELSEALMEIRDATMLYGRASTMKITIKINTDENIDDHLLVWTDVDTTPAKPKPRPEPFYATSDGSMSRRSPNQPQLPGTEDT